MAYFRPHPETSKRWIFDWLHWFVGNSAYLLGVCTIFLAIELPSAQLKDKNVEIILIVYIAMHVIVHLLLTFQHCKVNLPKIIRIKEIVVKFIFQAKLVIYFHYIKQASNRNDVNGNENSQNDPNKDMKGKK